MPLDLLWRKETCAVGGGSRVEGDLDPVVATVVAFRFAARIRGQVADHHVAAQRKRVRPRGVGIAARVVLADLTLRDALIFINHFPLAVLGSVSVENAFSRDLLGLLSRVVETGR